MNHKWEDDICIRCGIKREKRMFKRVVNTHSVLGRDGVWHDVPIHEYGRAWAFYFDGGKWLFDRPDCVLKTDTKAIVEDAPLRKRDEGGCTGREDITEVKTLAGAASNEVRSEGGQKQTQEVCLGCGVELKITEGNYCTSCLIDIIS